MVSPGPGGRLWGRARELSTALQGLRAVPHGAGAAFALVGEPGIGKTRLASELAEQAASLSLRVFWGRAWESGGAPAYWPWRQLLEAMRPQPPPGAAGPLGLLWSHQGGGDFSTSDPRQARFELFDAVVRALREQAGQAPTLCVLDDLHAADAASLELADFAFAALRTSPLAWVVTYRDAEAERPPVRDGLARLARRCTVIPLARLSREDSGALLEGLLPSADAALADAVFASTAGNPLFLCETARAMADGRGGVAGALPVSQGVALVVRERVAGLSPAARDAAEAGAVLGREVPLDLLAAAAECEVARARQLAAEVVSSGLWSEPRADEWLFSHALVRDALYREVPLERRARLHARVAGALDARIAAGRSGLALPRAEHALHAAPQLGAAAVAQWVLVAAREARGQRAYEETVGLLERAVRELPVDDAARAELLLALGWAYGDLGDARAQERTFDEALAAARRLEAPVTFGRAVLGRSSHYVLGNVRTELLPLIDEALARLPGTERDLQARLRARKASAMTPAADPSESLALARRALEEASGSGDTRAVLNVCVAAGSALGDFAPPAERIAVNTRLVQCARALADRVLELRGLSRLVTDHLEAGDVARADAVLLERDALATSLGHPRFRWMTPLFRSMRAMLEGRFDVCDAAFDEAQRLISLADDDNGRRCAAVHRWGVLLLQDRTAEARAHEPELLRRVDEMPALPGLMRAQLLARLGHLGEARAQLKRAAGDDLHYLRATNLLAAAAETAVLCGDRAVAQRAWELLGPGAESNATWGLFGLTSGLPVRAVLGRLGSFLGREAAQVGEHFEAALERSAAMGARAHEAWERLWFGEHLAKVGEAERAKEQLAACGELARALEMPGVAARAEAEAGRLSPPSSGPEPAEPTRAGAVEFTLRPTHGTWRLEHGARTAVLKDWRGIGMLARLLERPGEEIHSLELVSGEADAEPVDAGDAGELLDDQARKAYRKRIEQLSERIEDADERGDAPAAERARTELEALSRELSRAVGLGGRVRRAGSAAERARVTAQRRLREAIRRIGELDGEVGRWLEATVRTGTFCSYEPGRRARAAGRGAAGGP